MKEIKLFHVHMPKAVDQPLLETLHSGYITEGPKVREFEQAFKDFSGHEHVVSVNSGTSSLTLALRLAGVEAGDQVITTAMTCSATNLPILSLGAVPVFADVDPLTGLIDPESVAKLFTKKTKAVMAVEWGGRPVDTDTLMRLSNLYGVKLVVDAAHGMGAFRSTEADFTCYSLQAIKHITTVDGGLLACKSEADARRGRKLRWFGIDRESGGLDSRISEDITEWGYKFHMNDVAATIGLVQLQFVSELVNRHRVNALSYGMGLSNFYERPSYTPHSSYWLYTILLPNRESREKFKKYMISSGVQVSEVHRRNDEYSVFQPFAETNPGLDDFASRQISLPVHSGLGEDDINRVIELCNHFAVSAT